MPNEPTDLLFAYGLLRPDAAPAEVRETRAFVDRYVPPTAGLTSVRSGRWRPGAS